MTATIFATLGWALALALCVPGLRGRPGRAAVALILAAALLQLPLAGSTPIAALRGLFAELALGTTVVLAALLVARSRPAGSRFFGSGERRLVALLAAVVGLAFYPLALGFGPVDPYAWGYGGAVLPLAVGALAMLACFGRCAVLALALTVALVGWRLHWLASPNLWDYLLDPLLAVGGVVALLAAAATSAYRAMRNPRAANSPAKVSEAR